MSAIAEKVRKLLELARSDNPHEAAAATARAHELMLKYALSEEELRARDHAQPSEPVEIATLHFYGGNIPAWEVDLAGAMERAFLCRIYYFPGSRIHVVGRRTACDALRATWNYVRGEVQRLVEVGWAIERHAQPGQARRWKTSFCLGAVSTISERLRENMKQLTEPQPSAVSASGIRLAPAQESRPGMAIMVRSRQEEVDRYVAQHLKLGSVSSSQGAGSSDGYSAGRAAGRAVNLSTRATKALR